MNFLCVLSRISSIILPVLILISLGVFAVPPSYDIRMAFFVSPLRAALGCFFLFRISCISRPFSPVLTVPNFLPALVCSHHTMVVSAGFYSLASDALPICHSALTNMAAWAWLARKIPLQPACSGLSSRDDLRHGRLTHTPRPARPARPETSCRSSWPTALHAGPAR